MQIDSKQMLQQPSKDEIIYEFKYSFPKKFNNRIERIFAKTIMMITLCALFFVWQYFNKIFFTLTALLEKVPLKMILTSLDALLYLGILGIGNLLFIGFIIVCLNFLFLQSFSKILFTNKGIYIKASHPLQLWQKQRFYKYGTFGFYATTTGHILTSWQIKVYDISKKYNFFKKHSSVYSFAQNDETQNMDELLMLLRQKSKEMLEEQGKADLYDIKEKIRYETRNANVGLE